jgi:hypothetical protein
MPHTKIIFVKMCLDLYEKDDRFLYRLNEEQQLLYIKFLYLAGTTENAIPKDPHFICNKINYRGDHKTLLKDLARIKEVFPKLKEGENYYHFEKFGEIHNYIPGKPKTGIPQVFLKYDQSVAQKEKKKEKKKKKEKEKEKEKKKEKENKSYKLDFSILEKSSVDNLFKELKDKRSVKEYLMDLGFYERRIDEALEKAGKI